MINFEDHNKNMTLKDFNFGLFDIFILPNLKAKNFHCSFTKHVFIQVKQVNWAHAMYQAVNRR